MDKTFIADAPDLVVRALRNVIRVDGTLALDAMNRVVYRRELTPGTPSDKVLLFSGGGTGHEPAHVGFVGTGMLDVAVAGSIFASPSAAQVLAALSSITSTKGSLVILKNYTGDVLNFGLAIEKSRVLGQDVKMIVVGDDVSRKTKPTDMVGRRGLAGVILVEKIAGALAEEGASLEDVYSIAKEVSANLMTMGISLDKSHVPGRVVEATSALAYDEMHVGMGIHNESGVRRSPILSLQDTVALVLDELFHPENPLSLDSNSEVCVLVNNLGALSVFEINVISDEVLSQITSKYKIQVKRAITGSFVTSMNGPGFSVTLLKLTDRMEELLIQSTAAKGWVAPNITGSPSIPTESEPLKAESQPALHPVQVDEKLFSRCLESILTQVEKDEPLITIYDTEAGDGDCGETLLAGAQSLVAGLYDKSINPSDLAAGVHAIATTVGLSMGGTSGAIYGIFLNALALHISRVASLSSAETSTSRILAEAGVAALDDLCGYTTARVGHRTLMDALIPFVKNFGNSVSFPQALAAAEQGMEGTRVMSAVLGRATYVDAEILNKGRFPDPGALGLISILKGIENALGEKVSS